MYSHCEQSALPAEAMRRLEAVPQFHVVPLMIKIISFTLPKEKDIKMFSLINNLFSKLPSEF